MSREVGSFEEEAEIFIKQVYPDSDEETKKEIRKTFYAGALIYDKILYQAAQKGPETAQKVLNETSEHILKKITELGKRGASMASGTSFAA